MTTQYPYTAWAAPGADLAKVFRDVGAVVTAGGGQVGEACPEERRIGFTAHLYFDVRVAGIDGVSAVGRNIDTAGQRAPGQ